VAGEEGHNPELTRLQEELDQVLRRLRGMNAVREEAEANRAGKAGMALFPQT
jgi:hypothetical protein